MGIHRSEKTTEKKVYSSAQEVKDESLRVYQAIPEDRYISELRKLLEHCQKVVTLGDNYIVDC